MIQIVIPLAGLGKSFLEAGYNMPKPLVDVAGKSMIERVIENLKPKQDHKFIFIVKKDQYERYGQFLEIFNRSANGNHIVIEAIGIPQGAACTALLAIDYINNSDELIIANSDQIVDISIDKFIINARRSKAAGFIMTFEASHPKWSFVRLNKNREVIETAEKKVISGNATVGIYYYKKGSLYVNAALSMIENDIRFNNEFYVCPAYNELILSGEKILAWEIDRRQMHTMGTAEDLAKYLHFLDISYNKQNENSSSNSGKRFEISSNGKRKSPVQKSQATYLHKR